jgi:chromosome segregation ATPase
VVDDNVSRRIVEDLNRRLVDVVGQRDDYELQYKVLKRKLGVLQEDADTRAEAVRRHGDSQSRQLQQRVDYLTTQLERSTHLSEDFQEELRRSREDTNRLQQENARLVHCVDEQDRLLHHLQGQFTEKVAEVEQVDKVCRLKSDSVNDLRTQRVELGQENQKLKRDVETLTNELHLAAASHSSMRETVDSSRTQEAQLRHAHQALKLEYSRTQEELEHIRAELAVAQGVGEDLKVHASTVQQQLDEFKKKLSQTTRRHDVLKQVQDGRSKSDVGFIRIIAKAQDVLELASSHASRCAAKGYFAIKAKRLKDDLMSVVDDLADQMVTGQLFKTRRDVLHAVKEYHARGADK